MKHLALAALLVACLPAGAVTSSEIDAVESECNRQMAGAVCSVENDTRVYSPNAVIYIGNSCYRPADKALGIMGACGYPRSTYDLYRAAGNDMCKLIRPAAIADPRGPIYSMAKARWGR